ncbi:TonB-dependent receptor [Sphingobium chlorophenolicum L-1]|uniref:TonB-dependent receptor n=2 Tax=Sphingobium chlorophenolicum TaxID=46429 RepID=F6EZ99_SPHCR|nr:TonB-dependent receptor [Sphingobium chlorophenolicum L-1]
MKKAELMSILLTGSSIVSSAAYGQEAASSSNSAPAELGDIIVTAQKRSERLNDVPLSITAATGDQLAKAGVNNPADLEKIVPGFSYQPSTYGTPVFTIRGIGFFDTAVAVAPAVSVYVDQVPLPFLAMTPGASLDVERVEALKGPQGTLFGQNATGGAINYIAAKPTRDPKMGFDLTYGRFSQIDGQAYVSGPISSTLTGRIAVRHEYRDGWQVSQSRPGDRLGKRDFTAGRVLLDWKPSDTLRFEFNANGWIDKSDTQAAQYVSYSPNKLPADGGYTDQQAAISANVPAPDNDRAADWDPNTNLRRDDNFYQFSLRGDLDLAEDITLTSISAYSHFKQSAPTDSDGVPQNNLLYTIDAEIDSFSQELRVAGEAGEGRVKWMVGGNYGHNSTKDDQTGQFTSSNNGVGPFRYNDFVNSNHQKIESKAVFASLDYGLTDTLTAQGSIRYNKETRDFTGCLYDAGDGALANAFSFLSNVLRGFTPPTVALAPGSCVTLGDGTTSALAIPVPIVKETLKEDNVSWRAGLNWKPDRDTLIYVNVTKGYKAGSFPTVPGITPVQFDPTPQESVLAYEAGFKLSLFDRSMQLTGAAFYYDYKDKQILGYIPSAFGNLPGLVNIPKSSVRGAEIGINWRPVAGFTFNGGATYIKSRVDSSFATNDPLGAVVDVKGEAFPSTPKFQVSGDAEYAFALTGSVDAFFGGNARYRSKTTAAFGRVSAFDIPGYAIVDLRAGIESADKNWRAQIWGRNVFDKFHLIHVSRVIDTVARTTGMPATYGITLSYRY